MKLAIFDLDNTLIGGDSDLLWGEYLCEHGYVDGENYQRRHQKYYNDYLAGTLDIRQFLEFQLHPLAGVPLALLLERRQRFLDEKIRPVILDQAVKLIAGHRQQNHVLLIITATNRFLTEPIAELFGVHYLIASEAEIKDGRYTGKPQGVPSYAAGKVTRLNAWLAEYGEQPEESWCYSDSHNDLPLLRIVDHPVAVDPDEILRDEAGKRGWLIISLR
jgi:HAD superfamily hydrolase (TIGR01490 family)